MCWHATASGLWVLMVDSVCVRVMKLCSFKLQIAQRVADEFFEQGDMERKELNLEPIVSSVNHHGN